MRQDQAETPSQQLLQDSARATTDALDARLDKPHGLPTPVKVADYQAMWGDLVRGAASITITLPPVSAEHLGEAITVKHSGSTGTLNVIPAKGSETIDGDASKSCAAGDLPRIRLRRVNRVG